MDVFGLGLRIKEEGAAVVTASLKRLAGEVAATALTIGGITKALHTMVQETAEAQKLQAQLGAALRSTGGISGQTINSLNAQNESLKRMTAFTGDAIGEAQALLLTFTNIRQTFPDATRLVLDMAQALGTDTRSAAMQLGKALNDPVAGVTALGRAGVQLTDAQKEQIKAFVESGEIVKAQTVILKELETQVGGSAAAYRNTLGGALAAAKEAFLDLFELSSENASVLVGALNKVTDAMRTLNESMDTVKQTAIALGALLVAMFSRTIIASITAMVTQITALYYAQLAAAGAAGIHNGALVALIGVMQTATGVATAMWTAIGGAFGVAILAIGGAGALGIRELDKIQAIYDEIDRADQKNMELRNAAIRARAQAEKDAEEARKKAIADAIAAEKERIQQIIEYNSLLAPQGRQTEVLTNLQTNFINELARGNITLARRIELMKLLGQVEPLITEANIAIVGERIKTEKTAVRPAEQPDFGIQGALRFGAIYAELQKQIKKMPNLLSKEAKAAADKMHQELYTTFQASIGAALVGGVVSGIEQALASGSIGEGFKAMASMMLAGLGDAMIRFGTQSATFAALMETIISGFSFLDPATSLAAALAMIGIGAALKGAARGMFGKQSGGSAFSTASFGGGGGGGFGGSLPTTQLIFGSTSATTAAGMAPRTPMNVTVIGPNDPSAQRAIQELMNKANSRGRIG